MSDGKKYGLIIPNKAARYKPVVNRTSVFDDDNDEDAASVVNKNLKKESQKMLMKRQVQLDIEKAIADDPTVYEYDSIYDDLQAKKATVDNRLHSKTDRQPKYIGNLIKAAEDRKKEMERRMEKKIQKEREAEKGQFDDKESFVTDAYRQKMELMKQEEENERKKEQMEALMDVTKQSDLSGFYRNLLKQTVGEEVIRTKPTTVKAEPIDDNKPTVEQFATDDRDDSNQSSSSDGESSGSDVNTSHRIATSLHRPKSSSGTKQEQEDYSKQERGGRSKSDMERPPHKRSSPDDKRTNNRDSEAGDRKHSQPVDERLSMHNRGRVDVDRPYKKHRNGQPSDEGKSKNSKHDRVMSTHEVDHRLPAVSGARSSDDKQSESLPSNSKKRHADYSDSKIKIKVEVSKEKQLKRSSERTVETKSIEKLKIEKRTTENTLEDARAKFLARKAAMKVPVVREDSD